MKTQRAWNPGMTSSTSTHWGLDTRKTRPTCVELYCLPVYDTPVVPGWGQ